LIFQDTVATNVPASEDLTIKLVAGEGPEVRNASGTSTVEWEGNTIQNVHDGAGDDRLRS
jgi:hypothetical protein